MAVGTLKIDGTIDEPMGDDRDRRPDLGQRPARRRRISSVSTAPSRATCKAASTSRSRLRARAPAASLAAKVEPQADEIRVALSRFEGRQHGIAIALNAPTRLQIAGSRVAIDPTTLRLGGGRLAVQGVVDPTASDLQARPRGAAALADRHVRARHRSRGHPAGARAGRPVAMADPRIDATYTASRRAAAPARSRPPAVAWPARHGLAGRPAGEPRCPAERRRRQAISRSRARPRCRRRPLCRQRHDHRHDRLAPFAPLLGNQVRNVAGTLRSNLPIDIAGSKITGSGSLDLSNGASTCRKRACG